MLNHDLDPTFLDLIEETYSLWDQPMPDIDAEDDEPISLELEIEKTRIVLSHLPATDTQHFTMYCTFGALPSPSAPALRRALEMNALGSQTQGGLMAINPESAEMMMILRVPLHSVDAAGLVASLTLLVRQADRWRKTYFLDDEPGAKKPVTAGRARVG